MNKRTYVALVAGLTLTAIMQGAQLINREEVIESEVMVSPPKGEIPAVTVREGGVVEPLAERGRGRCLFVVVYSEDCPASRIAAMRWTSGSIAEPRPTSGWDFIWVSSERERGHDSRVLPADFPTRVAHFESGTPLVQALGIRAFPATITLDEAGRVTGGVVGAERPDLGELRPNCTYTRSYRSQ